MKDCSCPVGTLWRNTANATKQGFMLCVDNSDLEHRYQSSPGTRTEYPPRHFADPERSAWVAVGCWPGATILQWPGASQLQVGDIFSLVTEKGQHEFCYVLFRDEWTVWISRDPGAPRTGCAKLQSNDYALGWEKGIVIRPSGVAMPKRESEPVLRTLRGLKKEATQRAQRQGHTLRAWRDLSEECTHSSCVTCGATVVMDITPSKQTGQYIYGAAYNATCDDWRRMTLNGFEERFATATGAEHAELAVLEDDGENVLPEQPLTEQPSFEVTVPGMDTVLNPTDGRPYSRRFISIPEAQEYVQGLQADGIAAILNRLTVAAQAS